MTDQLNRSIENFSTPESVERFTLEVAVNKPHRLRQYLGRATIVACGVVGAASALFTQHPDTERTIGPTNIEAAVTFSQSVEVSGLAAADTSYGIGLDVDIKAPELNKIPEISSRISPIAKQIADKSNEETVLELIQKEYSSEISSMKNELIRESLLYMAMGALAGSYVSAKTIEKLSGNRQNWKFIACSSTAAMMLLSGAAYQSLGNLDTTDMAERLSKGLRQPFDEYILTSTSDMLVNLESLNLETQKQIRRVVTISEALSQKPNISPVDSQTWVIYSDAHDLPTVPSTLQTIAQTSNANAVLGLGDYGNTGESLEMELMDGLQFESTEFIGYDDIKKCTSWNQQTDVCALLGDPIPHGALSDNHDPRSIYNTFSNLGMISLDDAHSFQGIPIYALSGACYVESTDCRGDNAKKVNRDFAIEQLNRLEMSGQPMPEVGFFASYDAAEEFVGKVDTLFIGGRHQFSVEERGGSRLIYLDTVSQGFPRGAKQAGSLIIKMSTDGTLLECNSVQWQSLSQSEPSIKPCY
jgi:low affinity Fe/Cu permease